MDSFTQIAGWLHQLSDLPQQQQHECLSNVHKSGTTDPVVADARVPVSREGAALSFHLPDLNSAEIATNNSSTNPTRGNSVFSVDATLQPLQPPQALQSSQSAFSAARPPAAPPQATTGYALAGLLTSEMPRFGVFPLDNPPPAGTGYFGAADFHQPQLSPFQRPYLPTTTVPSMGYKAAGQLSGSGSSGSAGYKNESMSPESSDPTAGVAREGRPHRRGYQACQRCRERKVKCDLGSE